MGVCQEIRRKADKRDHQQVSCAKAGAQLLCPAVPFVSSLEGRFGSIAAVQPRPHPGSLTARKKETASHRNLSKPLCQGTSGLPRIVQGAGGFGLGPFWGIDGQNPKWCTCDHCSAFILEYLR